MGIPKELDKTQADEPDATSIRLTQRNGSAASWPPPADAYQHLVPDVAPTLDDLSILDPDPPPPIADRIPPTVREAEIIDLDYLEMAPNTIRSGSWDRSSSDSDATDSESDWNVDSLGATIVSSGIVSTAVGSGTEPIPPLKVADANANNTVMIQPLISRQRRPHECHYDWRSAEKREEKKTSTALAVTTAPTPRPANNKTIALRPLLAASTGPFDVEVIENVPAYTRYRDAVRLGDNDALLVMTDFVGNPVLTPAHLSRWKRVVRQAGSRGDSPDAVLRILNRELAEVGLQATATCARLDVRERLINVACAGAEPSFVLRSDRRSARVQTPPSSVALGRLLSAQFAERSLHFDHGDTLLMPSAVWVGGLEELFAQPVAIDKGTRTSEWLRQRWGQPAGGALLCLTLR